MTPSSIERRIGNAPGDRALIPLLQIGRADDDVGNAVGGRDGKLLVERRCEGGNVAREAHEDGTEGTEDGICAIPDE